MKTALITGITGMDGSHLAQYLISLNYKVYGLIRYTTKKNYENINNIIEHPNFSLVEGDLTDQNSIKRAIEISQPNEFYNLGAMSHVAQSFKIPQTTSNITGLGALRCVQSIRQTDKNIKFYQAGTSEMFGKLVQNPANQNTPFYPRSPYGIAKQYAYWITKNYRQSYGLFTCNGILFNHESQRRGELFVTQKIIHGLCDILQGKKNNIQLGNLDSKRDWGYAVQYIKAMHLMLQQDKPDDYVVATGQSHSIREFLQQAFSLVNLNYETYVKINPQFYRPAEVDVLVGDASKIKSIGWNCETTFKDLVKLMLQSQLKKRKIIGVDL